MSFLPLDPLPAIVERRVPYGTSSSLLRPFAPHFAAFRDGSSSPRAFLEETLTLIQELEPSAHAFVVHSAEQARAAADESTRRWRDGTPLSRVDGMPVVVKDMIETVDFPTQMNNPLFRDWQSGRDAAAVAALRAAGAVILGKTVTTEFAVGNSGPTRNPYDSSRTPGGSSSGSAAAVGGGMATLGLGTQTIASTIRPASFCGAYGYKPTFGALHTGGVTPLAGSLDHLGLIAASLEDLWASATVIAARAGGMPPNRALSGGDRSLVQWADAESAPLPTMSTSSQPLTLVRLDMAGWAETPDSARQAFDTALDTLARAGARILDRSDVRIQAIEDLLHATHETALDILAWEARWPFQAYTARNPAMVGERIHSLIARAAKMDVAAYERALNEREALRAHVNALASDVDAFVALASSGPAIQDHGFTGSRSYPGPWTLVGGPSLSLPLLEADRLPLGLQLMSFADRDPALIAQAAWVRDTLDPA